MVTLKGKGVFGGVAIGKISFYQRAESTIKRYHVDDIDAELKRVEDAKEKALEELKADGTLQSIVDKYINAN